MSNPFSLSSKVERLSAEFLRRFDGTFSIDQTELADMAGRMAPTVKCGQRVLNLDFSIP
ncbi:MAG: hypothetical protein JO002_11620, partial [Burkholderiaceae bacterium]|nr:hypothetical protein [Burkholderiaceae bacterium]